MSPARASSSNWWENPPLRTAWGLEVRVNPEKALEFAGRTIAGMRVTFVSQVSKAVCAMCAVCVCVRVCVCGGGMSCGL